MSRRRWAAVTAAVLVGATAILLFIAPGDTPSQRLAGAYRCVVPHSMQRLTRGGPSWTWATPPEARFSVAALRELGRELRRYDTRAFVVVRGDLTIYESYAPCHGPFTRHYAASASKALVGGLLAALLLDDGVVRLDDSAAEYIPRWRGDPVREHITLRQLATHSSGLDEAADGARYGTDLEGWKGAFWGPQAQRWDVALDQAQTVFEPGTGYRYSNPGFAAFSYGLAAASAGSPNPNLATLFAERVMAPLAIPDDEWAISDGTSYEVDGLELYRMGGGGQFSARALVAIGQLMLHGGSVQGQQILSPESVETITGYNGSPPESELGGNPAPGVGWHTNTNRHFPAVPDDAFFAAGAGHQLVLVVPSVDLVVVRSGGSFGGPTWGPEYWERMNRVLVDPIMRAVR